MHKKIKVVFVINNFLVGGVERLLFDIISRFDKDKFDIKIITVLGSGPLENSFRNLGISVYFAGTSDSFNKKLPRKFYWLFSTLITSIRLTLFLLKSKPDIVVSSLFQADVLGMTASKIVGVKKRILIQHDTVQFEKFIRFVKENFALNFSTKIVCVSETVRDFLVDYFGVENKKIVTIFNGINYEYFKKGNKVNHNSGLLTIGVVGRLEKIKGQIYVLEALKILKNKYNLSPETLFAGDGALRGDLEKYVVENNITPVKFLGTVNNIPNFLSKVDIIIIPSIEEGFGLVVLEAMVSGKVIIASDIKVMRELIKDGQNGLLFKPKNSDSLATILLKVLNDKDLCKKLQENASLFSEKNRQLFNICEVSNTYQELLISKN